MSYGAVVLNAIFPEAAGGEFLLHHHRESMHQRLTDSHDIAWRKRQLTVTFSKPTSANLYPSKREETIPAE